jgi:hypothetical protein
MQRLTRFFEQALFAPFLLAIQPVLHLFLINVAELDFAESIRSILISLLFAAIALSVAYLLLRDWRKASPVASLFILFFFLFGDISGWVVDTFGLGPVRTDLLILGILSMCLILWVWLMQKWIKNILTVNLYFNLLSVLLLINSGIRVNNYLRENGVSLRQDGPAPVAVAKVEEVHPDIYYIVLDGYGRQDILQALYEFDNSSFLQDLAARGFYVAETSMSNYVQTMLSLSSSLNMDYVQSLRADGAAIDSRATLVTLLQTNRVRSTLAENGYQLISFRNQYKATIPSAEIYYDDTGSYLSHPITAFESLVIDHSMARILSHVPGLNKTLIQMPYDTHRSEILTTFARVQEVPAMDGNYFVYAHIIAPHPPFVFDENGVVVSPNEPFTLADANHFVKSHSRKSYIVGYRKQIQYVNTLVLETVDAILAQSEAPPIIILQGDHGPGAHMHYGSLEKTLPAERLGILNAYYFPDQDYSMLYPSISPVNSFRVVLNHFFDAGYALLPDQHYYSPWGYPFDFVEITDLSLP